MAKLKRADILLVENNICDDIEEAKKYILAGRIRIGEDRVVEKPSALFDLETKFNLTALCPFVSRGAYKILPVLDKYLPDFKGKKCLDIGASTGGFTDLMLQRGAEKVYAVDVGHGQLHQKLRVDPRVAVFEKLNARYISSDQIKDEIDVLTMDVSFISVTKILPAVTKLIKMNSFAFILVKPQFEVMRGDVEKGGVVRSEEIRLQCVEKIRSFMQDELLWENLDVIPSPILGPKGNQEYVICKVPAEQK